MTVLADLIPDAPAPHRVCGRECTDGSPCQNVVDTPGDVCWIDSHRAEDPRADAGPRSPDDVPLSSVGTRHYEAAAGVGSALGLGWAWWLGLGRLGTTVVTSLAGMVLFLALALAVNAYRRRALSE